jgi:hypothetical protein
VASGIQTCFITAPAGTNLKVLTDALRQRGIRVVVPESLEPGAEFGAQVLNLIADADLVIGVLTHAKRSEWVLFELGLAWGRGKRVVLFAPPDNVHLPSNMRGLLAVRSSPSNREAVAFTLDQLLAAPEPALTPVSPAKETRPLGPTAEAYLRMARGAQVSPAGLEELVARTLRVAGVDVVTHSERRDLGVDLAIWSDGLQPSVGNPLLVEIKGQLPSFKAAAEAAQRLSKYVAAAGGLWGLLLYREGPDDLRALPPNVPAPAARILRRDHSRPSQQPSARGARLVAAIDQGEVQAFVTAGLNAATMAEQGRALEDLICYLFDLVPGITITHRDAKNVFANEEVDVALFNEGIVSLPNIILVEAKNWSNRVGSIEVAWFLTKLQNRGLDFGILVTTLGITGNAGDLNAAHSTVAAALAQKRRVIVMTTDELLALTETDELLHLIKTKLCDLAVKGTIA